MAIRPGRAQREGVPMPYRVAVIGAGFGGIGIAIALKQAGIEDFVVLDQADDLGGTWRDNSYPGLTCDIPSHLYSFSFQPWRWSPALPAARRDPGLPGRAGRRARPWPAPPVRLRGRGGRVRRASRGLEPHPRRWRHAAGGRGRLCRRPARPARPARHRRPGLLRRPWWHSARWNHDVDLAGRRVAVVGTGPAPSSSCPDRRWPATSTSTAQRPVRAAQGRPALP